MVGIKRFGAYIPRYRVDRKMILEQMGWYNTANAGLARGEKAMANYDEDTISMAVSAARNALGSAVAKYNVDGAYLASMSLPFANRLSAGIVADALALSPGARTADYTSSLRCGTTALLTALDAAKERDTLVCAADARRFQPGSAAEYTWGDGAGALLVGSGGDVAAELMASSTLHCDFIDYRRLANEHFDHGWEERWIRDKGYTRLIRQAVDTLLKAQGVDISRFARVILPVPNAGAWKAAGRAIGAAPEQLEDTMLSTVGDTGSALPFLMLCAALEKANPGDDILLIGYGYGVDVLWLRATSGITAARAEGPGVETLLSDKKLMPTYAQMLAYKDLLPIELGIRGDSISPTASTVYDRLGAAAQSLQGGRCRECGTPQFPRRLYCVACGAPDSMEAYEFIGRNGRIVTFTSDYLAFSMDPPQHYGLVDFEDGGRMYLEYTDCVTEDLYVGCMVKLSFRVKHKDPKRGVIQYFWKAVPVKKEESHA